MEPTSETSEQGSTPDADAETPRAGPTRWPSFLVGLPTVLTIVSVFTVWTRSQILDNDEWVDLSTELIDQPEVREALAVYHVDTLYEQGNLTAGATERLPRTSRGWRG
jgi:hypothetical protein